MSITYAVYKASPDADPVKISISEYDPNLHHNKIFSALDAPLTAKCGAIKAHHFARQPSDDYDKWKPRDMTEWHLRWQALALREYVECRLNRDGVLHIADTLTADGLVIEYQHSFIKPEEIREREQFYDKMIWVFDLTTTKVAELANINYKYGIYSSRIQRKVTTKPTFYDLGTHLVKVLWSSPQDGHFFGEIVAYAQFIDQYLANSTVPELPDWAEIIPSLLTSTFESPQMSFDVTDRYLVIRSSHRKELARLQLKTSWIRFVGLEWNTDSARLEYNAWQESLSRMRNDRIQLNTQLAEAVNTQATLTQLQNQIQEAEDSLTRHKRLSAQLPAVEVEYNKVTSALKALRTEYQLVLTQYQAAKANDKPMRIKYKADKAKFETELASLEQQTKTARIALGRYKLECEIKKDEIRRELEEVQRLK